MPMNSNVERVISNCKNAAGGELFLSTKPRIDDLSIITAHLYSFGGRMCNFDLPYGRNFQIWNKDYIRYAYKELEFVSEKGFKYLFSNWDNMIKTCRNRACDKDNFKNGKCSGSKNAVNHYERMRENMIAAYNPKLDDETLAVIDMEYSVNKKKLDSVKIDKNPKADLICAAVEGVRVIFYITEYKSTKNGFNVSLQERYDDMTMYYNDVRIKEHLIKTLQERVKYDLIECSGSLASAIHDLTAERIDVRLLFLFSNKDEYAKEKTNVLVKGYKYILDKSKADGLSAKYAYIKNIEEGCLKKTLLRDFEENGKFEL